MQHVAVILDGSALTFLERILQVKRTGQCTGRRDYKMSVSFSRNS
jgi:hypothetical protein